MALPLSVEAASEIVLGYAPHVFGRNGGFYVMDPLGQGQYEIQGLLFHMAGYWEMAIDIQQAGKRESFCADLNGQGYCLVVCDPNVPASCRSGYECVGVQKLGDPASAAKVCLPK